MAGVLLTVLAGMVGTMAVTVARNQGARWQVTRGHPGPIPVGAWALMMAALLLVALGTWVDLT